MKSGENWSSCFRVEDVLRLQDFIHTCSPGARAENPRDKIFIVIKRVCYFDHTMYVSAISL